MLNSKVFDIKNPMIPFTKKDLKSIINKNITVGYISTNYYNLIETIKNIQTSKTIPVTLNVNTIYNSTNNPIDKKDVLIKVEGIQTFDEYINNAVNSDESSEYLNFLTYSVLFKDSIKQIKLNAYKKYLWNYHNIDSWFNINNIGLTSDTKNKLIQDFDYFNTNVLNTNDYLTFINACSETDLASAATYLIKAGTELLHKHKTELNIHINTSNKREEQIILNNPIILQIYMLSNVASQCKKDWPRLKFSVLDKRSLDSIALWED